MTSPTIHDRSLLRIREKRAVNEFAPTLWLDGRSMADNVGAREFVTASSTYFDLTAAVNPGVQDFWFAFWMYGPAIANSIFASGGNADGRDGFLVDVAANKIRIGINDSVQATRAAGDVWDAAITANTWTHCAINFDRDGLATGYRDGVLQTATLDISGQAATLGAFYGTSCKIGDGNNIFAGRLARIAYGEGSLLTAADVAEMVNGGRGKLASELSAALAAKVTLWWDCTETTAASNLVSQIGSNAGAVVNNPLVAAGPSHAVSIDGGVVSPWTCRGRTHHIFTQETIANRPTWTAATNSVTFAGTNDSLKKASAVLTSATTGRVQIVAKTTEIATEQVLYSQADEATADQYLKLGISSDNYIWYKYDNGAGVTVVELKGNTALSTDWHVLEWESDGSLIAMKVDGAVQLISTVSGTNAGQWFGDVTGTDNSIIGAAQTSAGTSGYLTGSIAEIVGIEPDDTATNATRLRTTLARKAGIVLP